MEREVDVAHEEPPVRVPREMEDDELMEEMEVTLPRPARCMRHQAMRDQLNTKRCWRYGPLLALEHSNAGREVSGHWKSRGYEIDPGQELYDDEVEREKVAMLQGVLIKLGRTSDALPF